MFRAKSWFSLYFISLSLTASAKVLQNHLSIQKIDKKFFSAGMASLLRSMLRTMPRYPHVAPRLFGSSTEDIQNRIKGLVKEDRIVVFMKGTPDAPKCGFSNAVVRIFEMHGVDKYSAHDVLEDEDVRQGIKEFSNWPTIPQVYIDGDFVGGCDIMIEMHQNGELVEELKKLGIQSTLIDKWKRSTCRKNRG